MLIIEEGAERESGGASTAAGGMLGHSDPVATVMQAGSGRPGLIRRGDVNMATGASGTRSNPTPTKH